MFNSEMKSGIFFTVTKLEKVNHKSGVFNNELYDYLILINC